MKAKKLNSADIADMTGIPRATMLRYRNGTVLPAVDALIAIAKVLNVTINYLLGLEEPEAELTRFKNQEQVQKLMESFTTEEQFDAVKYLEFLKFKAK